ncbi:YVTN family beta-propeller protein [Paraburkholderia sp. RAU6.4a]|uniref:YncE family protein n=1 Tax=Paraburkholderia sp. RAU6.4a TaxID=2991067 RepID=UPI003D1F4ED1
MNLLNAKLKNILSALIAGGVASLLALSNVHAATGANADQFEIAKRYGLEGGERWDYVAYDAVRQHLFISRDTHVQVIDTRTGKPVGEIANTAGVHGFAFVEDLKLGFVTNGRANTVSVVDLDTLKVVDSIKAAGSDPDGILYVPALRRIFVSNGHDGSVSAIDVATRKVVATMSVGGKPEALAADSHGHVFVNVEDRAEIVEMDGRSATVLAHWPLARCESPTGLAIDPASERLFSVCANHRMMIVDATSGRRVAEVLIGGHPDAAAFDPALKLAFSSNGADGTLTIVHEDDADHYTVAQNMPTLEGAKTMALDEQQHRIYLVSSKFGAADPATAANSHPRATVIPGTFEVLEAQLKAR